MHKEFCEVMESKGRKWECEPQYKGWVLLEEVDEIERVDSVVKSSNETADELCLKAESTGKLTFVTQTKSICLKCNTARFLDQEISCCM